MNNNSGQPNGTMILVLGILGIVCLPILGPVAWIMGNNGLALINSGQGDESQRGNTNVGRICGIVGTVFLVLGVIGAIVNFAVLAPQLAAAAKQAQTQSQTQSP
jgi:uncharacterized membrane protein YjgN (DUF898 family)